VPVDMLLVMALALGVGGLVKGATGMGLPIVALPVLASFLGVPSAIALMCMPIVLTNAVQVWRLRSAAPEAGFLPAMILGGAAGIALGTWLIVSLPEDSLSLALAGLLFIYIGLRLANPHFRIPRPLGHRLAPSVGLGAGVLQGATGISAPIGVTFIHALQLPRTAHVFAVSAMFLTFSLVQVPALAIAGVLTWELFLQSLIAILPALAAMPVGAWLGSRLSQRSFDLIVLVLLAVVAVQLTVKSLV